MEKNKLLKFLFSLVPGAGYMYLNMMAKGVIFMTGFAALSLVSMGFWFNGLVVFLPVLWCYTFFDTFHVGILSYEERITLDKEYLEKVKRLNIQVLTDSIQNKRRIVGGICLLVAVYMLFNRVLYRFMWYFFDGHGFFYEIFDLLPSIVVAILLLLLGIHLLKGEKAVDFKPYEGGAKEVIVLPDITPSDTESKEE